jgi:hypothetical protein
MHSFEELLPPSFTRLAFIFRFGKGQLAHFLIPRVENPIAPLMGGFSELP